jgi:hypothetical protein
MGDEDRGRTDLIKAILRVLPVDPENDLCVVQLIPKPEGCTQWGPPSMIWDDPKILARRILDALDEAYTDRDLQDELHMMVNAEREEPF